MDRFARILDAARREEVHLCMSRINLGEVRYCCHTELGAAAVDVIVQQLLAVPVEIVSVTDDDIDQAANLKCIYKLSYADCFAAVLSMKRNSPLVTGDTEFRNLASAGLIKLEWLGA